MYNPEENRFVPISPEIAKQFEGNFASLTPQMQVQRTWTRFSEGETIEVKGINFRVDEIGERRIVLKPINKAEFSEKQSVKE